MDFLRILCRCRPALGSEACTSGGSIGAGAQTAWSAMGGLAGIAGINLGLPDGGCASMPSYYQVQPTIANQARIVMRSWIPSGFMRYPGAPGPLPSELVAAGYSVAGLDAAYGTVALGSASDNGITDARDKQYRLWSKKDLQWTCTNGQLVNPVDLGNQDDVGPEFTFIQPAPGTRFNDHTWRISANEYGFTWGFKAAPKWIAELIMGLGTISAPLRTSVNIWHVVTGRMVCNPDGSGKIVIDKFQGSKFPNHALFVNGLLEYLTKPGYFSDLWIPDPADSTLVIRGAVEGAGISAPIVPWQQQK